MFEDSLIESGNKLKTKRLATSIVSFFGQFLLLGILILIPLIYTEALPKTQLMTFLVAPPPPPPPPPPPAAVVKVVKIQSDVVNGQLRTTDLLAAAPVANEAFVANAALEVVAHNPCDPRLVFDHKDLLHVKLLMNLRLAALPVVRARVCAILQTAVEHHYRIPSRILGPTLFHARTGRAAAGTKSG